MGFGGALSTLPNFLAYFVVAAGLVALVLVLYVNLTPQRDIRLIRAGNSAAALVLVGALLGFVIPLASGIAHSGAIIDLAVRGILAPAVPLVGFLAAGLAPPALPH